MENLLGRKQFIGETSNLFTDEKITNARAKVVAWLNELVVADSQVKCELLAKIQETIMRGSCDELLEEFIEPILSLAHDTNMDVRRAVVGFMEEICKNKVEFLPQIVNVISLLLRDRSPQVIKRVIQACGSIYKNGIKWICSRAEISESTKQAWEMLTYVKAKILDMIDNDNDGIRTNAIKFLEGVVVLQSYPDEDSQKKENDFSLDDVPLTMKLIRRRKLEEEANNIFDILLKFHAATHISSVNLIACTGSLCTIAKLRPSLMGPVIEAFNNLNSNLPPTLTDSQVSSVRKSLKMQLIALLKNRGSFEYHSVIKRLLLDLGASQSEINRTVPKMDKQEQVRRQKRILENATNNLNKKMRIGDKEKRTGINKDKIQMEIDMEELEKQRVRSMKVNEKFISENLRNHESAINMVIANIRNLPDEVPSQFLEEYTPIRDMSINQQISKIAGLLGQQMTDIKIGPGAAAFTKEPPMRPCSAALPEQMEIVDDDANSNEQSENIEMRTEIANDEQLRKDEATKKLRENMERAKGEQALLEHMKQRAKSLKLQELPPFSRTTKEKFLLDAVKRILNAERRCVLGGVSVKRRKILTVMAATFPDNVRYYIFEFIMLDIKNRIDLAFSWLYEEYCLLQGFTRHTYVKSENRPDYAYNELLIQIITGIINNCEFKDKILLLRRVFLESPLISDGAINKLVEMCHSEELSNHCLDLIKDLAILRPPRKQKFIRILLTLCVHERLPLRERALEHIVTLYNVHKVLPNRIEAFAIEWLSFLEKETPPANIFAEEYGRPIAEPAWKEDTAKICLIMFLTLLPYAAEVLIGSLCKVYISTSSDLKRTILRSIDSPIKELGPTNPVILKLIDDCPKGVETLVIRMIYYLTERAVAPDVELVKRARELYATKVKDVRVLIPILGGLTKSEILAALPKLLKLNQIVVKEVFNRLLCLGAEYAEQNMPVTPSEILVALHTIDPSECDLKCIVKATSICIAEKDIYTQEILGSCLQLFVEITPLPTLLMRTIIQSLTLYPRLESLVISLLQRLIFKQVWKQKVIWEGFLKCCQRLKPQSMPVLLQLPHQQLLDALNQCPDLRPPLLEYAKSVQHDQIGNVSQQTMDILTGKTVDVFVTDDTGGYIAPEHIKKEIEEVATDTPVKFLEPGQPLPPGED